MDTTEECARKSANDLGQAEEYTTRMQLLEPMNAVDLESYNSRQCKRLI